VDGSGGGGGGGAWSPPARKRDSQGQSWAQFMRSVFLIDFSKIQGKVMHEGVRYTML